MKKFASIYIGTYEVTLKIYQVTREKTLKHIDTLQQGTDIASDIDHFGKITFETENKLCEILSDMKSTMEMYKVTDYDVCIGYAIRNASNYLFILDQIKKKTSLTVRILSNSEQRFTTYVALSNLLDFSSTVSKSALLCDIGGYSIQLTYFKDGALVNTQQLPLGLVRVSEYLNKISSSLDYREQINEMIDKEFEGFIHEYLHEDTIENVIIVNDQAFHSVKRFYPNLQYNKLKKSYVEKFINEYSKKSNFSVITANTEYVENSNIQPLFFIMSSIYRVFHEENFYFPGITITDGIVYRNALAKNAIKPIRDYDQDIITAAYFIEKRCGSYEPHLKVLEELGVEIINTLKKESGLTARDTLLYRVSAILHDCGKYISLAHSGENSYTIINSSEILGLTHKEREMIAYVALFNRNPILPYDEMADRFSEEEYIKILKLLAILRVTNALDRSHRQKFKKVKMSLSGRKLIIKTSSEASISLEKGLFSEKADFFEEIFNIRPVIKER